MRPYYYVTYLYTKSLRGVSLRAQNNKKFIFHKFAKSSTNLSRPATSTDNSQGIWYLTGEPSVPARQIYEGSAPCPYCLAPCPIIQRPARIIYLKKKFNKNSNFFLVFFNLQNVIAVFVFSDSRCKNACNCLQICAHVFINRPQNCAKTSFHSRAGL